MGDAFNGETTSKHNKKNPQRQIMGRGFLIYGILVRIEHLLCPYSTDLYLCEALVE